MTFKSFKSFHVWAVYQINTLKHSMLSFFSSWRVKTRFERFLIYLPYGVIIRDKVGNFGQFDGKTLFRNESNYYNTVGQIYQKLLKSRFNSNIKLMYYATCIIAIRCKFKHSTRATLNVTSARVKLNKDDNWMFSEKILLGTKATLVIAFVYI